MENAKTELVVESQPSAAPCWRCGGAVAELRVRQGTPVVLWCAGVSVTRMTPSGGVLARTCTLCGQEQAVGHQAPAEQPAGVFTARFMVQR